jgi:hypothetical protein
MRWQLLITGILVVMASGCHFFQGLRLAEVASASGKPSNVATLVSVMQKGQPVADLGVASFHVSENGQILDPGAVDLRLLDPATVAGFHTVLLIDLGHGISEDQRRQLGRATAGFVRRVRQKQSVTVLAFDGSPRTKLVGDFSIETNGTGPEQLENLTMMVPADRSRNLNGAVISALDSLDGRLERSNRPIRVGTLVVFSRGPDIAGRVPAKEFEDRISHTEHQLIYVDVAGDPISEQTTALTIRGKIEAQAVDTLPIAFENAAILANQLRSQYYLLSYCSPARSGKRNLRVEVQANDAEGQTETDAFETVFDSTGFSPSCNSGNPPRFSVVQRPSVDRATNANKPTTTTAPSDSGSVTNSNAPEPPYASDKPNDNGPDVEVPPPKKRGYAP